MKGWRKQLDLSQTIFALTTGALPSSVAIVKLSGVGAFEIAKQIFSPSDKSKFSRDRGLFFGSLHSPSGEKIDDIVVTSFVAPASHSGEDTVEFHCHGSPPIIHSLQKVLVELGARPAERGEFSYRGLLNGKFSAGDLENLGDLFLAREEADLKRIYERKDQSLAKKIGELRNELIRVQAILDTAVDFSEEYASVVSAAFEPVVAVIHECSVITQRYLTFKKGEMAPRLVLVGRPNAGKSSLFNALLGRYRAIVHAEAGTTRDVIEEDIELGRRRWKLVDTAGLRKAEHTIEKEGISLGEEFLAASSFWLLVVDGTSGLTVEEERLLEKHSDLPHLLVWNKSDLPGFSSPPSGRTESFVATSAQTGAGINELWETLENQAKRAKLAEGPLPTAVQANRLEKVSEDLLKLKSELEKNLPPEYLSERNREILSKLDIVIGEVSTEDVLDRLFGEFCIGK